MNFENGITANVTVTPNRVYLIHKVQKETIMINETTPAVFEDELSVTINQFICDALTTVVLDGVTRVTDLAGRVANADNNYLMSADGSEFSGLLTTVDGKVRSFRVFEGENGKWAAELPCALVA